jgi:hypothetical protein
MITAKQKMHVPRRRNAGDQIWTTCTAWVFPHLRTGAVRRLLSSEPKRRKLKKVPPVAADESSAASRISSLRLDYLKCHSSTSGFCSAAISVDQTGIIHPRLRQIRFGQNRVTGSWLLANFNSLDQTLGRSATISRIKSETGGSPCGQFPDTAAIIPYLNSRLHNRLTKRT